MDPGVLFAGTLNVKVDEKGRLKLPALLKTRLEDRYKDEKAYFVTSLNGDRAFILPFSEYRRIMEIVAQRPQFDELKTKFVNAFNFWGAEATLYDQGRMLVPSKLREAAGLAGDVTLVAHPRWVEVHNAGRYEAEVKGNPFQQADYKGLSEWGI